MYRLQCSQPGVLMHVLFELPPGIVLLTAVIQAIHLLLVVLHL
jgi:hypothetical protein